MGLRGSHGSPVKVCCAIVVLAGCTAGAGGIAEDPPQRSEPARTVKLPGLLIDFRNRCVDVDATVCLDDGLLELVACTKGSKEHESIVAVSARPMHIHTALLSLGVTDGHPAMRKQVGVDKRWVRVPARGDEVRVFFVTTNKDGTCTERPIRDFVVHSPHRIDEADGRVLVAPGQNSASDAKQPMRLPTAFVFAGSDLRDNGRGPRQYLADLSGNVISIATFGDELLCLPFHEPQARGALNWRVKPGSLPKVGTQITLRLRPRIREPRKVSVRPAEMPSGTAEKSIGK